MNQGISILQGPHHVAQKSIRSTLPLSAARLTSLLFTSLSVKFRFAGFAFAGQADLAGPVPSASAGPNGHSGTAFSVSNANPSAPTVATAHRMFMRRLLVDILPVCRSGITHRRPNEAMPART